MHVVLDEYRWEAFDDLNECKESVPTFLSTLADRQGVDISVTVCGLFFFVILCVYLYGYRFLH